MDAEFTTEVRFYRLSEALQPYFTALYATAVNCAPDVWVRDRLHPEWAALRFTEGPAPVACIGIGEMTPKWPFVANGPTSKCIQFGVTRSRVRQPVLFDVVDLVPCLVGEGVCSAVLSVHARVPFRADSPSVCTVF